MSAPRELIPKVVDMATDHRIYRFMLLLKALVLLAIHLWILISYNPGDTLGVHYVLAEGFALAITIALITTILGWRQFILFMRWLDPETYPIVTIQEHHPV